jgi:hypothetical protein
MTFRIQYALGAALLAAAFGLTTPQANAQQGYKGTFNLPFETYWGGTVLEPGHYTVSVESPTMSMRVLRVTGDGGTATILTGPSELMDGSSHGRLVLAHLNGTYAIQQFDAGGLGRSFTFTLPKAFHDKAVRAGHTTPAATTSIAVE